VRIKSFTAEYAEDAEEYGGRSLGIVFVLNGDISIVTSLRYCN
jgi:hypothetical protein